MHKFKKILTHGTILFILVFGISLCMRLWSLADVPEGFHHDEASVGYNAYAISKTGHDEYERSWPLIFEALGDYKLPVVIYTAVPFAFIFGLHDFWIRFPTAFFGALTPLIIFGIVKQFASKKAALLAALSLSLSPWHILFSRSVNESTISVFFAALGIYLLQKTLSGKNGNYFVWALFAFLAGIFSYRTQFIFVPLFLIFWFVFNRQLFSSFQIGKFRNWIMALIIFGLLFAFLIQKAGSTRVKEVGLQASAEIRLILEEQIREDGRQVPFITRAFHNKALNFVLTLFRNYAMHFDISYLFFTGDKNSGNNSTPYIGHLLLAELPIIILGFAVLVRRKKDTVWLPLVWLGLGPIASSLTVDTPSSLRNLISVPAYAILFGIGMEEFSRMCKKGWLKGILFVYILIFSANVVYFTHMFVVHKKVRMPWGRDAAVASMLTEVESREKDYAQIIFGNYSDLYIFYLYYRQVDPNYLFQVQKNIKEKRKEALLNALNPKYYWMNKNCIMEGPANVLFVCSQNNIPDMITLIKDVRYSDELPAFTLLEFPQNRNLLEEQTIPYKYARFEDSTKFIEAEFIPLPIVDTKIETLPEKITSVK